MSQIIVVKDSTNSKLRELECDASGNLKVNTVDISSLATETTLQTIAEFNCDTTDVTISSSALPAGAALESSLSSLNGKVSVCNTGAVVVSGSALPAGAALESSLSSLNGKVAACNTGAVIVSASALPAGAALESSLSSLNGKVSACNTGAVVVSGSALPAGAATEASMAIVAGAVNSGVMQVSAHAAVPASHSQVWTAQGIISGSTVKSASKDIDSLKSICIFGNSSVSSGEVQIEVSHNSSNWYELNNHYLPVDMSSGDFGIQIDCSAKYVRLSRANSSGSTETINAHISAK